MPVEQVKTIKVGYRLNIIPELPFLKSRERLKQLPSLMHDMRLRNLLRLNILTIQLYELIVKY